jgi:hypothetical protein
MYWKDEREPARIPDARFHSLGKLDMNPITGRKVPACLGDSDDRTSRLQLLAGEAVISEALQVDGSFAELRHVVEPDFASKPFRRLITHK